MKTREDQERKKQQDAVKWEDNKIIKYGKYLYFVVFNEKKICYNTVIMIKG
ncbi:MAG: hypothetical protein HFH82_11405 [Lachnospiraceae bacterium]|nr:hypothetical protein [Lachnospiraceae bacterium]